MKESLIALFIAAALGGCATFSALTTVTSATVTATEALVAANAFDAIKSTATGYLTYCKAQNNAPSACSATNRSNVILYTRSGTTARNQIETYIQTSTSVPSAIYNALVTAVNSLKASPAATTAGAQ